MPRPARNAQAQKKKGCFTGIVKFAFFAVIFFFVSIFAIVAISGSDSDSTQASVSNPEFDLANKQINTSKKGTYSGNNQAGKDMAKSFSETIFKAQKELFTGGKENRVISLTGEQFLTYCKVTENKVCFLVHVPQFKRYKGETRDSLLKLSWAIANKISSSFPEKTKVAVCLRGSIMYGGVVNGVLNKEPKYINKYSITKDTLYPLFD